MPKPKVQNSACTNSLKLELFLDIFIKDRRNVCSYGKCQKIET